MDSILSLPPRPLSFAELVAHPSAPTVTEAVALALAATEEHDDAWATTLHAIPSLDLLLLYEDGHVALGEPAPAAEAAVCGAQLAALVRTLLRATVPTGGGGASSGKMSGVADGASPDQPGDRAAAVLPGGADLPETLRAVLARATERTPDPTMDPTAAAGGGQGFDYPAFRLDLMSFGNPTPALLSAIFRRLSPAPLEPGVAGDGRAESEAMAGVGVIGARALRIRRSARIMAVAVGCWLAGVAVGAGAAILLDRAGLLGEILNR